MSLYGTLFNTIRIPKIDKDALFQNESAKDMVVLKGGNFYIFYVFDKDGKFQTAHVAEMDYV